MKKEEKEREEKIEESAESVQSEDRCDTSANDACADSECSCSNEVELLKAELCKKDQEIASLKDVLLRNKADFDNFRKRIAKTEEQNKKMSVVGIAGEIIKINDDLIRTVEAANSMSAESSADDVKKAFSEGVVIISKEIATLLQKHFISEIEAENCPFDPNFHEAVEIDMQDGIETDTVTKVYQKGYKLEDFVIRSAKVKVSKPLPKQN
ncbi:MAG TPA: nucleotide exchange factor GrpE [Spirochaetota bacterium]|nr:nucleotide exchange factor GrpE [Spirochaetota bacterium]HOR43622.1 nucleotide exchange factor GrpE [Spirochaetota bacterium]HOU83499.1 nucleotide exchange factor GrpE [Spirochaetota bacterium]HPK55055.1 nucleotide exchange factor GrpE [Spirochaetota bacterium]HQE59815.1 nucleotide exchange factor GrpE [Spirochaetota bacterium]